MTRSKPDSCSSGWSGSPWPVTFVLTGILVLVTLLAGTPFERMERQWFDQTLRWRAQLGWTPAADPRVTILGIDDIDLSALPDLQAEYHAVATAISQASELGAAVIVLDAIYVRGSAEMAKPMVAAIESGPPVVLAEAIRSAPGAEGSAQRLRSFPFRTDAMGPAGLINIHADADGVHRSYDMLRWTGRAFEPSLALAAYMALRGADWKTDIQQPAPGVIRWTENLPGQTATVQRELTEHPGAPCLLNFRGPWSAGAGFLHLTLRSLRELHAANAGKGAQPLAGKVIIFANTATGVADVGTTSFGANQPLVLLHATALDDLLQSSVMRRTPRWMDALLLLLIPLLTLGNRWCRNKRLLLFRWILGAAIFLGGGVVLLFKYHWLTGVVTTALLWTASVLFEVVRRHTVELNQRRRLRDTMALYFTPRVLEDVLANPGRLEPKRVEITVLLTDLRNSTPLAEKLGAHGMLDMLNQIFGVETRAVFDEEGSLEKPVGDQFLAYWGAPEAQADAADRAVRAARALIDSMEALRPTFEPQVRELFGYGVALHTGHALIANIGSGQFFHYGVVGDLINAAARVESLTKYYGVLMIITREVYAKLSTPPPARVLDQIIVKGKGTPLELMEIQHKFTAGNFGELAARYGEAFALYQRGDFSGAHERFLALVGNDNPSRIMADRCRAFAQDPPPDWNGIYKMESK